MLEKAFYKFIIMIIVIMPMKVETVRLKMYIKATRYLMLQNVKYLNSRLSIHYVNNPRHLIESSLPLIIDIFKTTVRAGY